MFIQLLFIIRALSKEVQWPSGAQEWPAQDWSSHKEAVAVSIHIKDNSISELTM